MGMELDRMKIYIFLMFALIFIALASIAIADDIVIEYADSIWTSTPQMPIPVSIDTRFITNNANTIYHNVLNQLLDAMVSGTPDMGTKFIIYDANSTFRSMLAPMNPAITDFVGNADKTNVNFTWTALRKSEFPNVMIVYSKKTITWHPIDGLNYQIGKEIDSGVFVGFMGNTDNAIISGLSANTLYNFAIFAYDNSKEFSIGSYTSAITGESDDKIDVWAGDTNNDGIVDERDVLPIGVYWEKTGTSRDSASAKWEAQKSARWTPEPATYADANGDGVVDERDVLSIGINWHKEHALSASGAPIFAEAFNKKFNYSAYLKQYLAMYQLVSGRSDMPQDFRRALRDLIELAKSSLPKKTALGQNYPNPFNPETWIPYQLSEECHVSIRIYEVSGKLVRTLNLGAKDAGDYASKDRSAYWDGRNDSGERVASGVYFYQLQTGSFTSMRKLLISK
jgi:hypothetical protein